MPTRPRPCRVWMALTVAAVLTVSACGGAEEATEAAPTAPAPTTAAAPSGAGASELGQPVGAVDMLSDFRCAPEGDTWRGAATLTNTTDAKATFEVTFTVIETQGNAVVGETTTTHDLAAGESTDVEAADIHDGDEDGLQCVRRVLKSS